MSPTNSSKVGIQKAHESSFLIIFVLSTLSIGSLFSGFVLKDVFIGVGSIFLGNSVLVLPSHFSLFEAEFLPSSIKMIPLIFSLSGACLSLLLMRVYSPLLIYLKLMPLGAYLYTLFNQKWFFDRLYNIFIVKPLFHVSYVVPFRSLDKGFIELVGPLGITAILKRVSQQLSHFQTGLVYHYTFILVLSVLSYVYVGLWLSHKGAVHFEAVMYYLFMVVGVIF